MFITAALDPGKTPLEPGAVLYVSLAQLFWHKDVLIPVSKLGSYKRETRLNPIYPYKYIYIRYISYS